MTDLGESIPVSTCTHHRPSKVNRAPLTQVQHAAPDLAIHHADLQAPARCSLASDPPIANEPPEP